MWLSDTERQVTFINRQAALFTGIPTEKITARDWAQVIHPADLETVRSVHYDAVDRHVGYQIEYRARRADGEYRHMLSTASPRYVGPEYAGHVGSLLDVTDLKLRQQDDLTRRKWESIGVLAGGIAHDFNNLLGGILAQAELIETELPATSRLSEETRRIKTAAVRGSEIVRELMIYSGNETRNFQPTDVSTLVEEMLGLLQISISKRATLKINLGKDLPKVWGHASEIRQVVMNLIINASEALRENEGVIEVTTSRVADGGSIAAGGARELSEGEHVLLEVSDTGCGLTDEQRTRIFDPFFTTKFPGRGLGLAVVQGIVRSHQGMVNVESAAGQGTTLQIYLPCTRQSSDSDEVVQNRVPTPNNLLGRTVLLVEDEEALRHSLARMLRMQGLSVLEAGDGSAAIHLLRKKKYRVEAVLLDLTIPGASSRGVIDEAQRNRPETKLIVVSAHSLKSAEHSLKMRIPTFVRKPFRFADLLHVLSETLSC
jgi:PAS domain S-box-containing protein